MLTIRQCGFTEPDFAACFAIRLEVFVGEQNVPLAEESDAHDATALHFLALHNGRPAGTARALRLPDATKITRVAVLRRFRGLGIGEALMRHIEAHVPAARFILDAQLQALAFYARLGYHTEGEVFNDSGIPHRRMIKPWRESV